MCGKSRGWRREHLRQVRGRLPAWSDPAVSDANTVRTLPLALSSETTPWCSCLAADEGSSDMCLVSSNWGFAGTAVSVSMPPAFPSMCQWSSAFAEKAAQTHEGNASSSSSNTCLRDVSGSSRCMQTSVSLGQTLGRSRDGSGDPSEQHSTLVVKWRQGAILSVRGDRYLW